MEALFSFVARDAKTLKATEVNPLQPASDADKELFRQRHELAQSRKAARKREQESPGKSSSAAGGCLTVRAVWNSAAL